MKKFTSDNIGKLMDDVDKCKILIELLEVKNNDNDWQLSQMLSMMKDLLQPVILELIDISDDLWKDEQAQKQQNALSKVA